MPFCPQCGIDNPASARFCDQCGAVLVPVGNPPTMSAPAAPVSSAAPTIVGAPVVPAASSITCAQCGAPAIPGEAFCDNCGAPLNAPTVQPSAPPAYSQPSQPAYPPPQPAQPTVPASYSQPAAPPAVPPAYSQPVQPAAPPAYSQPAQPAAPPAAPPIFEPAPAVPPPAPMQPPSLPHKHLPSIGGSAPVAARTVLAPARLTVVQTGAVLPLPNAAQALLGRADAVSQFYPDIDLTAHGALEKGVGRRHLRLFVQNGQIMAEDQDSTNGTIINGQRQPPRQPLALRDGDTIQLGTLILRFNEL
jgi:hypothetical protein